MKCPRAHFSSCVWGETYPLRAAGNNAGPFLHVIDGQVGKTLQVVDVAALAKVDPTAVVLQPVGLSLSRDGMRMKAVRLR